MIDGYVLLWGTCSNDRWRTRNWLWKGTTKCVSFVAQSSYGLPAHHSGIFQSIILRPKCHVPQGEIVSLCYECVQSCFGLLVPLINPSGFGEKAPVMVHDITL